jgi:membrane-associated protease RseP (regulator of RpoE activity)
MFNFLPVIPFDGGAMAPKLFAPLLFFVKKEKREKIIVTFFIVLIVILLLLNLLPIFG